MAARRHGGRAAGRVRTTGLIALLVGAMGCGSKKVVGPTGGDLTVAYAGPSSTDGALLIRVNGAVESVKSIGPYQVASGAAGAGATRVIVTGDLTTGDLFRVTVKDLSLTYTVQIEAIADRNTFALGDPASYSTTIRK